MRRIPYRSCSAYLFLVCLVSLHVRAATPPAPVPVVIGNPVVELTGPWRFHPGDDQAWAGTDYDDSGCSSMDLTPPADSFDPTTGSTGFLLGWTAKRYPKLTGYAWYRLRVDVRSGSGDAVPPLGGTADDDHRRRSRGPFEDRGIVRLRARCGHCCRAGCRSSAAFQSFARARITGHAAFEQNPSHSTRFSPVQGGFS